MMKIARPVFLIGVTFLIFYLIFRKIDYLSLKEVFRNANLLYLIPAVIIFFLSLVISAKKWQAITKAMSYSISFKESLRIVMATLPLSVVTPSKSGDLIRAYYLKDKIPPSKTAGAVITERLIDISVLAAYSVIGSLIIKNWLTFKISLLLILSIIAIVLIANKIKLPSLKWQKRIENFLTVSKIFIKRPGKLLPVLLYSLILLTVPIIEAKILFLALGADIPLLYISAAFPIAIFIGLLPITIAGMGTRDSAIIYLFSSLAEPGVSLGVGLLYTLLGYWFLALLGLPVMRKMLR